MVPVTINQISRWKTLQNSWPWKIFDDDFPPKKWPFFWVFSHFCWEMSVTPATPLWSLISTLSCRVTISTLTVPRFPQSERVGLPNERKLLDFHSLLLEILVYEKHITILTGIVSVQFMFKHMII